MRSCSSSRGKGQAWSRRPDPTSPVCWPPPAVRPRLPCLSRVSSHLGLRSGENLRSLAGPRCTISAAARKTTHVQSRDCPQALCGQAGRRRHAGSAPRTAQRRPPGSHTPGEARGPRGAATSVVRIPARELTEQVLLHLVKHDLRVAGLPSSHYLEHHTAA